MNISENSKKIIDSCRFCWMCRHICPIGNATGQERNTSRARALSLSLVTRGGAEFNSDIIDNVYECALCGACTKECATGWDPVVFTEEARLAAALEGKLPAYVEKLLDNYDQTGNIYGEKAADISRASDSTLALFVGADARVKAPDFAAEAIALLEKAGVDFAVFADEPDSGAHLEFLVGPADETRKALSGAVAALSAKGVKKLIVLDPADAKMFVRRAKEWGIELPFEVATYTSFVAELYDNGSLKLSNSGKPLTYQDPAALARDLEELEPARKLIAACGAPREMLMHGRDVMLAGNLVMNEYLPNVMKLVVLNRFADAAGVNAETVVVACPAEYALMKKYESDIKVVSLASVLLAAL